MKIKFLDIPGLHKTIAEELHEAIMRVVDSGRFIKGPEARAFENEFADFCKSRFCIGCSSGTSALHSALWSLGIGQGDEVLTVSHTFIATAEAIVHAGARPRFVDIDEETYLIDPDRLKERITRTTRAIIVVHLYGQPAEMDSIMSIARQHELWIIEDAAQAVGAAYHDRPVGTLGDIGCFSFFPGKNLGAMGDAGAVVVNDERLADRIRMFVDHGRKDKYVHDFIGYNYRMDEIQAAVLRAKLPHLKLWNERRRSIILSYKNHIHEHPGLLEHILLPKEHPRTYGVFHLFVIRTQQRDKLREFLNSHGIETGIHYPVPLHLQPPFLENGEPVESLPVTEKIAQQIISLPLDPLMSEEHVVYVIEMLERFFRQ